MAAGRAEPGDEVAAFTGVRRAVLFGCDVYDDQRFPSLRCARADVDAMREVLADPARGQFDVAVLPAGASRDDVIAAVEDELRALDSADTFLLYFSGHAFKDRAERLSLALARTDIDRSQTAVPLLDLITLIDNSLPQKIILIFDCCFSGAIQQSFRELQQVKDLWMIAASTAAQPAYEKEGSQNSIMTGFILDGLRSGFADLDNTGDISVSEAYTYTQRLVRTAFLGSGVSQEPTVFLPTGSRGEVVLALNPRRTEINLANISKTHLKLFAAATGMAQLVREAQPYRFFVMLFAYDIEGVHVRASGLTVGPHHTPNMLVTEQGFDCDAFFPPELLTPGILAGRQVVEGRVRVRLHAPFDEIMMIAATREQDIAGGDSGAVTLFSKSEH